MIETRGSAGQPIQAGLKTILLGLLMELGWLGAPFSYLFLLLACLGVYVLLIGLLRASRPGELGAILVRVGKAVIAGVNALVFPTGE